MIRLHHYPCGPGGRPLSQWTSQRSILQPPENKQTTLCYTFASPSPAPSRSSHPPSSPPSVGPLSLRPPVRPRGASSSCSSLSARGRSSPPWPAPTPAASPPLPGASSLMIPRGARQPSLSYCSSRGAGQRLPNSKTLVGKLLSNLLINTLRPAISPVSK